MNGGFIKCILITCALIQIFSASLPDRSVSPARMFSLRGKSISFPKTIMVAFEVPEKLPVALNPELTYESNEECYFEIVPDVIKIVHVPLTSRRDNKAHVEVGPGSFKSEIVEYPPDFFTQSLKKLIKIKAKMEEEKKDLNQK